MGTLTPLAIKIGSLTWIPKLLPQITWLDKLIQRISRGHWSILRVAGLPNLMLTVVGRKSGVPRSTPLLCVPYRNGHLIAGSNFGGPKTPVWVVNVRAADRVTVAVGAEQHEATAREITGEEREAVWEHMLSTWPNYARYAARTDRTIPVFFLKPGA
ncbi:nitroreductase family deazaflavin-dependent oxidoreductase [Kribbella sp. CA-293567]|uniref:nitroreductase family deazaflavin-dependent oxidoreductase n=1 Tax=Kribbella sp. CA-293567 TaxID=3002436 RepID=UPI0022DDC5DD|nr:nitroreductase family deazaflavin-dependent oxidoreductase [Kribbella sp. CA-293567]WBQ02970.1 nitroreductase family deazaflavin-dependent oxidoreductase [Kribbella sp. CA-293567]